MNEIYQVSELKAVYKPKIKASDRYSINSALDAYNVLKSQIYNEDTIEYKECVYLLLLNTRHKLLGFSKISEGGIDNCMVDIRIILQSALLANASSIILSHNHPSGSVAPSGYDDTLTGRLKSACDTLNIKLTDHIIVSDSGYYSYLDEGRL